MADLLHAMSRSTAFGIAFQRGMFAELFRESGYEVRNLSELGPEGKDVHFTHAVDAFFREGGGAPPVCARERGRLGRARITFMEALLGVFVRADDPAAAWPTLRAGDSHFRCSPGWCSISGGSRRSCVTCGP